MIEDLICAMVSVVICIPILAMPWLRSKYAERKAEEENEDCPEEQLDGEWCADDSMFAYRGYWQPAAVALKAEVPVETGDTWGRRLHKKDSTREKGEHPSEAVSELIREMEKEMEACKARRAYQGQMGS